MNDHCHAVNTLFFVNTNSFITVRLKNVKVEIIKNKAVYATQRTQCASVTKRSQLILFSVVVTVYCQSYTP
jgi:hypothetical protein